LTGDMLRLDVDRGSVTMSPLEAALVADPTEVHGDGDEARHLELLRKPVPQLPVRAVRMLEVLAELMDMPQQIALQVAIANTLAHVQAGRSIHVAPLEEPPTGPQFGSDCG
jgi:hypothetical protein